MTNLASVADFLEIFLVFVTHRPDGIPENIADDCRNKTDYENENAPWYSKHNGSYVEIIFFVKENEQTRYYIARKEPHYKVFHTILLFLYA